MDELKIEIENKVFTLKKTLDRNYEVTPYDETIKENVIMDAILDQTDYYVMGIQTVLPQKSDGRTLFPNVSKYYLVKLELKEK